MFLGGNKGKEPKAPVIDGQSALTETFYGELRRLAAAKLANQVCPEISQATSLVHEAWLRLGGDQQPDWANRAEFFAAAARVMRFILVDRARHRQALRHGGGKQHIPLESGCMPVADLDRTAADDRSILALNEALKEFQEIDPEVAELVQVRYFSGLTISETAEVMGYSERTTFRRLNYAHAWLAREMKHMLKA